MKPEKGITCSGLDSWSDMEGVEGRKESKEEGKGEQVRVVEVCV